MIRMLRKPKQPFFLAAFLVAAVLVSPGGVVVHVTGTGEALAAAKTYNSKGKQENTRNLFETCRLKKVERVEGTQCIYRRQSGGNDVVISNDDPNVPCQREFQCKRQQ